MSQPIAGTVAETYLRNRGITALHEAGALRFHPRCYYRPDEDAPTETWPAMIAARHRSRRPDHRRASHLARLRPDADKAPIDTPRRAMGDLLGNAVRFGVANDVMAAGEGIETMLSLRCVLPTLADGGGAFGQSPRRHPVPADVAPTLYRPRRRSGRRRGGDSSDRTAEAAGIEAIALSPRLGDFNEDLRTLGIDELRAALRIQLAPQDVVRFMLWATAETG